MNCVIKDTDNIKNKYETLWYSTTVSPLISIVIPAYNVEKYLEDCLASLLRQNFKDFEAIIVNDGSTDSTELIANIFQSKDTRFKVINQKNSGLSAARNTGIQAAKGDYICFIDSDDWVDDNFLQSHYDAITAYDADITASTIVRWRKNMRKYRVYYTETNVYEALEDKIKACNIPQCCYVWNKLYRKDIVVNHLFSEGKFFEDILWIPDVLKSSKKLVTVPDTNYYYRVTKNSIVKKNSPAKQYDSYCAKKFLFDFFVKNNLMLDKKLTQITKDIKYFLNIPIIKIKESANAEVWYLFEIIPVYRKNIPYIDSNTVIVWEPCSSSHSEVVPGYAKYLLDMGYKVSAIVNPQDIKDGLFSRFNDKNLILNNITRKEVKQYFKKTNINLAKGIMVTTAGKLCDNIHFEQCYKHFHHDFDKSKLYLVEHDAKFAIDNNKWQDNLITLRKINYKGYNSIVVNPHYFGEVKITPKNDVTNFLMIGRLVSKKMQNSVVINALLELKKQNYNNFKLTLIGKGNIKHIPAALREHIDIKGRLPYDKMYEEIEKADFMLTSYDKTKPEHIFYNTTGTSGNYQLVYGFLKPIIIIKDFAEINGFTNNNSILYEDDTKYAEAMIKAINLTKEEYQNMQNDLKNYVDELYKTSLKNLRRLING